MRAGGIPILVLLLTVACSGIPAHAQDKLVMNDIAPFVDQDISIEPKLLTVKDVSDQLKLKPAYRKPDNKEKIQDGEQPDVLSSPPSPLEKMYSDRVTTPLRQFGYDMFDQAKTNAAENKNMPAGAVQDNFTLSVGDELSVLIRGQRQDAQLVKITSEGLLVVGDLAPIPAAGRSLGEVRAQLNDEVGRLYNTDVFLSLTHVNQVSVLVIGHVKNPGRQTLTSFDSVIDALMAAGGVDKTGTLRQIRLVRNDKTVAVDLYGLLIFSSGGPDITLRNNDKIIVGPVGPTVAVAGDAKRAGIYEILPALRANWNRPADKSQKLSMNDLLGMAGGVLSPAAHRYLRMDLTDKGAENVDEVKDPASRQFGDGDILNMVRGHESREGSIELLGNTNQPGLHSLNDADTLSALLYDDSVTGIDTYPLIGVIEHWNRKQMAREFSTFTPKLVLSGAQDRKLLDGDKVYLFSQGQIDALKKTDPQAELIDKSIGESKKSKVSQDDADDLPQTLRRFLIERSLFVRGAVREPGAYPVAEGATLDTVLSVAGGETLEGDKGDVEITSDDKRRRFDLSKTDPHSVKLSPGDTVRVNQKTRRVEDNNVLMIGEVKNPGTFDLKPGDTLGRLLARAGDLTDDAYPEGAIFSRASERKREEARFKSQAQELELRLAAMLGTDDKDKKPDAESVATARDLIAQLKNAEALGRITVEADPARLQAQPQLDILLESGDRIYVPKRPLTVRVAGEVMSPAALQFRSGKKPREYINEAGGTTYNADDDRSFVVYPDGSAQPLAVSAWNHKPAMIPPGSTVVVPRDPKPLSFIDGAKDISQILANVATAAIFADDLRDNRR